jgi:hypothetical protein
VHSQAGGCERGGGWEDLCGSPLALLAANKNDASLHIGLDFHDLSPFLSFATNCLARFLARANRLAPAELMRREGLRIESGFYIGLDFHDLSPFLNF